MPKLTWDNIGERTYETGVDHGILFPQKNGLYPKGVAWSGLTSVAENPSGAEDNAVYADNIKYLNIKSAEDFGATIECVTYPDEWAQCNGMAEMVPGVMLGQQARNTFGLAYRTRIGNDTAGDSYGFKLHLIYGCSASPSSITYSTVSESVEPNTFSFEISTTAIPVEGNDTDGKPFRPVASITIDSTKIDETKLQSLLDVLEGTEDTESRLPLPNEIKTILAAG